jgi:hypothetical protein
MQTQQNWYPQSFEYRLKVNGIQLSQKNRPQILRIKRVYANLIFQTREDPHYPLDPWSISP